MKKLAALLAILALTAAACSSGDGDDTSVPSPSPAPTDSAAAPASGEGPDRLAYCRTLQAFLATNPDGPEALAEMRRLLADLRVQAPEDIAAATAVYAGDWDVILADIEAAAFDLSGLVADFDDDAIAELNAWTGVECRPRLEDVSAEWATDFDNRTIELDELVVGVATYTDSRDRIAPLDEPVFEDLDGAGLWLTDRDPGIAVDLGGDARFYPIAILTAHEIVNDQFGDLAVAVTYCPLCNSAVVFDRSVDGRVLRFGTSGLLRNSDLVMWDDVTQSLWQQITGEAIVGELAGTRLEFLPSSLVRFGDFREAFPDGRALSRDTGFNRTYGINSYEGYSSLSSPNRFSGEVDDRFPALERVVGVDVAGAAKAYPFSIISAERVVNDEVGGEPIVVVWGSEDTADPLDSQLISAGRAIGTGVAYLRTHDGQVLTFRPATEAVFEDLETGSQWDIFGRAVAGPLAGARLGPVIHRNEFWFAWTAFNAGAPVYGA